MRLAEIALPKTKMKTYLVRLKLKSTGYTQILDTTIQAVSPQMARKIIATQYNSTHVLIGQPREIKPR
jgi:hypothetical protein